MEELSNKEKELAPEWVAYFLPDDNDILFVSKCKTRACWLVEDLELESGVDLQDEFETTSDTLDKLIDQCLDGLFDITEHEVYDHISVFDADNLVVEDAKWIINKDRAVAIAKALGVTGDDL